MKRERISDYEFWQSLLQFEKEINAELKRYDVYGWYGSRVNKITFSSDQKSNDNDELYISNIGVEVHTKTRGGVTRAVMDVFDKVGRYLDGFEFTEWGIFKLTN